MKKIILFITFLLILTSCDKKEDGFSVYRKAQDYFNNETNYTISEINNTSESTYIYANNSTYILDDEKQVYIYLDNGESYVIAYDKENDIFFRESINNDDHYFYPYTLIERLSNISAFLYLDELKYENNKFVGDSFTGSYMYNGKLHSPTKIEIILEDNRIVSYYEEYECEGQLLSDSIKITNYGISRIKLPLNVIDLDTLKLNDVQ